MEVIISHQSTDFDSLAAMVAAKKIYKDALLVFTGAIERNVRKFISIYGDLIEITPIKKIKIEEINKLIIVDTRIKRRIGPFANVINKRDLEIHIYDHHPPSSEDLHGALEVVSEVGATVTLAGDLLGFVGVVGYLDTAGLAAPSHQHLRFDDDAPAKIGCDLAGLLRRAGYVAFGNRDAVLGKNSLGLVLV